MVYSTDLSDIGTGDENGVLFDGSKFFDSSRANLPNKVPMALKLLYHADIIHFDFIRSMTGLIGRGYFCRPCNVKYNNESKHCCPTKCPRYRNKEGTCQGDGSFFHKECELCWREFLDENCYYRHLHVDSFKHGMSVCFTLKKLQKM